jgi:asparagine synthase (glutamine-hydrolysing)
VPFLDHSLVEFSLDIPMADKVHGGTAKYLLKKAVEGLIPDEIIYRKKMGFGAPMSQWMRGAFGKQVEASMLSSSLLERGFFNRSYIANLFKDHNAGRRDNSLYIWTLFNLTAWYDYWIGGSARDVHSADAAFRARSTDLSPVAAHTHGLSEVRAS